MTAEKPQRTNRRFSVATVMGKYFKPSMLASISRFLAFFKINASLTRTSMVKITVWRRILLSNSILYSSFTLYAPSYAFNFLLIFYDKITFFPNLIMIAFYHDPQTMSLLLSSKVLCLDRVFFQISFIIVCTLPSQFLQVIVQVVKN